MAVAVALTACGAGGEKPGKVEDGGVGVLDVGAPGPEGAPVSDGGVDASGAPALGAHRFATQVVAWTHGLCAGFGQDRLPGVVLGPPVGGGLTQGGLDVLSLGKGGEIVLGFGDNAVVDGPGPDLIVFENAFSFSGDPTRVFAELGEVSVSEDGVTWSTYPCTATAYPYGACAGWHPTFTAPGSGIAPDDVAAAGGDPFDLADVGLTRARFVRIRDMGGGDCVPDAGAGSVTGGFDLDAVVLVHAERP